MCLHLHAVLLNIPFRHSGSLQADSRLKVLLMSFAHASLLVAGPQASTTRHRRRATPPSGCSSASATATAPRASHARSPRASRAVGASVAEFHGALRQLLEACGQSFAACLPVHCPHSGGRGSPNTPIPLQIVQSTPPTHSCTLFPGAARPARASKGLCAMSLAHLIGTRCWVRKIGTFSWRFRLPACVSARARGTAGPVQLIHGSGRCFPFFQAARGPLPCAICRNMLGEVSRRLGRHWPCVHPRSIPVLPRWLYWSWASLLGYVSGRVNRSGRYMLHPGRHKGQELLQEVGLVLEQLLRLLVSTGSGRVARLAAAD